MLFGIEKDWAKQFAELYQSQPDWYTGNVNAFTAAHLGTSLASLGTVSAASSVLLAVVVEVVLVEVASREAAVAVEAAVAGNA